MHCGHTIIQAGKNAFPFYLVHPKKWLPAILSGSPIKSLT